MSDGLNLRVEKLDNFAGFGKSRAGDAAFDLYAAIDDEIKIERGATVKIPTGIKTNFSSGYFLKIEGRSGMALNRDLTPFGGVIDPNYEGEINVILHYLDSGDNTAKKYIETIKRGDKIAQLVPIKVSEEDFQFVDKISTVGVRGDAGFGSSGR